jgi:hypothetical protein
VTSTVVTTHRASATPRRGHRPASVGRGPASTAASKRRRRLRGPRDRPARAV